MINHRHRLWNSKIQLLSELLLRKACHRAIRSKSSGIIVCYADANRSAYSATKWALIGFTNTLSIEPGEFGIRANAIPPGAAERPRIQRVLEDRAKLSGKSVQEEKKFAMTVNRSNGLSIRAILRH